MLKSPFQMAKVKPVSLKGLKTYPLAKRKSLVDARDFGTLADGAGAVDFINSLPRIYAGRDLRALIRDVASAHRAGSGSESPQDRRWWAFWAAIRVSSTPR